MYTGRTFDYFILLCPLKEDIVTLLCNKEDIVTLLCNKEDIVTLLCNTWTAEAASFQQPRDKNASGN